MKPLSPSESPAVVELRQYTLHPGQRDTLIELFERVFVEPQEAAGILVMGQFRDLDRPDRFVWLRGFAGMSERASALAAFYGGPVWAAHRDAANATMVDSDDVLLLRPARPGIASPWTGSARAPAGTPRSSRGQVIAQVCTLRPGASGDIAESFDHRVAPLLARAGAELAACLVTEPSPNSFPRLPVRKGESVFVWFARLAEPAGDGRWLEQLAVESEWHRRLLGTPQTLRLVPTARSRFHA